MEAIKSLQDKIEDLDGRMERGGDCNALRAERRVLARALEAIYEARANGRPA